LFGLAAGALLTGPLADRIGRKRVLVASVFVFALALFCVVNCGGSDATHCMALRYGVGLGAAMPNAVTLMSEYCPINGARH